MLPPALPDWHDPTYLLHGSARQQQAYAALQALGLWSALRAYDPVLTGTVPLSLDLPGSDLDIICEVPPVAQPAFERQVRVCYGQQPGFRLWQGLVRGQASVVASFWAEGEAIELFGQAAPTRRQHAYRHLVLEYQVLAAGGARWQAAVRALKQQGLKTEPAFAQLLGLPGDPYLALLQLAELPPAQLAAWLAQATRAQPPG